MTTTPPRRAGSVSARSIPAISLVTLLTLCLLSLLLPSQVWAAGSEITLRGHDLNVVVDTRWAGNKSGGYYPLRIRITNTGPTRELLLEFSDSDYSAKSLPKVQRQVVVEQNTTQQFSLSIPLVGTGTGGLLRIINAQTGLVFSGLHTNVAFPGVATYGDTSAVSLLTISLDLINLGPFAEASTAHSLATTPASPYGGARSGASMDDHQVIPPNNLPETWLDYTGVDMVAVPLEILEKIPSGARGAIIKWVEAGGTLIVYNTKDVGPESAKLATLLDLAKRQSKSRQWTAANPASFDGYKLPLIVPTGGMPPGVPSTVVPDPTATPGTIISPEGMITTTVPSLSTWTVNNSTFHHIPLMHGHVYAFSKNPFPGGQKDWSWWLSQTLPRSYGPDKSLVTTSRFRDRIGGTSRARQTDFFNYMVPGVGGIHVIPFLGLITLFTVLIGPVNYVLLWRRKQLYLLVATIPLIAFFTSVTLFGYAVIADGFGVQSRVRSLTLIDQGTQTAVVRSRQSYYAGWAPSAGLNFSYNTGIFPIWPDKPGIESGSVDWTQSQHLTGTWLRSRTPTQFLTVSNREFRSRLTVTPLAGGTASKIRVANGLGTNIKQLFVTNDKGEVFVMQNLPANAESELTALIAPPPFSWESLFDEDNVNMSANVPDAHNYRRGYGYGFNAEVPQIPLGESLLEQDYQANKVLFTMMGTPVVPRAHQPGKYYTAVVDQNPALENGSLSPATKSELHIVRGYY